MRKVGKTVAHSVLPSDMPRITKPITKVNSMTHITMSPILTVGGIHKGKVGLLPDYKITNMKKRAADSQMQEEFCQLLLSSFARYHHQQMRQAIIRGIRAKKERELKLS